MQCLRSLRNSLYWLFFRGLGHTSLFLCISNFLLLLLKQNILDKLVVATFDSDFYWMIIVDGFLLFISFHFLFLFFPLMVDWTKVMKSVSLTVCSYWCLWSVLFLLLFVKLFLRGLPMFANLSHQLIIEVMLIHFKSIRLLYSAYDMYLPV